MIALDRLKEHFGWDKITLAGTSGGGHLVAAIIARRADIDCAVIASGNVAVRKRLEEHGLKADVTGYTDFVDPLNAVRDVARHPPRSVIMLTDPQDELVTASSQAAYLDALERFPAKWTPVCAEKMRRNKELEPRSEQSERKRL